MGVLPAFFFQTSFKTEVLLRVLEQAAYYYSIIQRDNRSSNS